MAGGPKEVLVKVLPQPRVSSVTPRYGSVKGGLPVTIHGQYFGSLYSRGYMMHPEKYPLDNVTIGGVPCMSLKLVSDSQIVCIPAPGIGASAVMVSIRDTGTERYYSPFSSRLRAGALAAEAGYRQVHIVVGGSFLPSNPSETDPGFLAVGPSGSTPGTHDDPAASSEAVPLTISRLVTSLAVLGGSIYAGGTFTSARSVPVFGKPGSLSTPGIQKLPQGSNGTTVVHILRYDGHVTWPLGMGVNGDVLALQGFKGSLVVGGAFTEAYPRAGPLVTTGGIAMWNPVTESWSPVGGVIFTGVVMALAAHQGALFAGGRFDRFGPDTGALKNIAVFEEGRWWQLGDGVDGGHVNAIAVAGCKTSQQCLGTEMEVFAGGSFSRAGSVEAARIARWADGQWLSIGSADGDVFALEYAEDKLYVGGAFKTVLSPTGVPVVVDHVAKWQAGVGWTPVGEGVGGTVYSLRFVMGCIYVAGAFNKVCNSFDSASPLKAQRCGDETNPEWFLPAPGVARFCLRNQTIVERTVLPMNTTQGTNSSSSFGNSSSGAWNGTQASDSTFTLESRYTVLRYVWEPLVMERSRAVAKVRALASFLDDSIV
jgi:hypothetical protein